jgi:hypothetical protein
MREQGRRWSALPPDAAEPLQVQRFEPVLGSIARAKIGLTRLCRPCGLSRKTPGACSLGQDARTKIATISPFLSKPRRMFKRKRFLVTCDFEKRAKARRQVGRHARTALFNVLVSFCKRRKSGRNWRYSADPRPEFGRSSGLPPRLFRPVRRPLSVPPELLAGDARAVDQRLELGPHDRGVNLVRAGE